MTAPALPRLETVITASRMGPGGIHNDDAVARAAGLPGAIVQGGQLTSLLVDMLLRAFGASFVQGGELDVEFRKPVRVGDVIVTHGRVVEASGGPDDLGRAVYEVWLENQSGHRVVTGRASGVLRAETD